MEEQKTPVEPEKKILHQMDSEKKKGGLAILLPAGIILLVILAGALTGYFLAGRRGGSLGGGAKMIEGNGRIVSGANEMGVKDSEAFPDKAEGKIEVNDSEEVPEGSHQLRRSGGESQTAYLTSSVVDLDQFVGKCVEVWGETFAAQTAAWLMDIGFVKKLDKCPEGL